jgi:methionyl-tRNA formyltransferase
MKKIIRFYVIGYKGFHTLQSVVKSFGAEVIKEVIIGRDMGVDNDFSKEIEELCQNNKINKLLRSLDINYDNTISISIGWRWIIDLKRIPNLIVLHDSLLPRYRGFNPLVSALINGDRKIGVSALFATENYDQGELISQVEKNIFYPIKINKAIEIVTICYIEIVLTILNKLTMGESLPKTSQTEDDATYSLWRDDDDYRINWEDSSDRILRFIDAVGSPYKGATTLIGNQVIIITDAEKSKELTIENRTPGKVIYFENGKPIVVCGKGLIKIISMIDYHSGKPFNLIKIKTRFS